MEWFLIITDGRNPKVARVKVLRISLQISLRVGLQYICLHGCNLNHLQKKSITCVTSGGLPRFGLGIRHLH